MTMPMFYARHKRAGRSLNVAPALPGWAAAGTTSQARHVALIDDVRAVTDEDLRSTASPLALRLDIGLPEEEPLLTLNDLGNYVYPLIPRLTATTGRHFVSVWATKRHVTMSSVAVYQTHQVQDPSGTRAFQVRTTASIITTAFRQQIRRQAAAARPLPAGGVALQLSFVVGPRRAWPNLWKVTIDSLGPLFGQANDGREERTRDGRITDLGLHCVIDAALGHDVIIAVRADNVAT